MAGTANLYICMRFRMDGTVRCRLLFSVGDVETEQKEIVDRQEQPEVFIAWLNKLVDISDEVHVQPWTDGELDIWGELVVPLAEGE